MNILEIKNLSKVFGKNPNIALELARQNLSKKEIFDKSQQILGVYNINLNIKKNEIFVIVGMSGSGKSTFIRLLNRLIDATSGSIMFKNKNVLKLNSMFLSKLRQRHLAMVFQSFALMPHMTIFDNTMFGIYYENKMTKEEKEKIVWQKLQLVGLDDRAHEYPENLSGGMRQRVGLARALACRPDILIMDEAFSALDPLTKTEMQDELLKIQKKEGVTIIFISHDIDEAIKLGDRIGIMHDSRLIQVGSPEEIIKNPINDYVASFFDNVNMTNYVNVEDICKNNQLLKIVNKDNKKMGIKSVIMLMTKQNHDEAVIVDEDYKYQGIVSIDNLNQLSKKEETKIEDAFIKDVEYINASEPINQVFGIVAKYSHPIAVVNDENIYLGTISKSMLLKVLDQIS